MRLYTIETGGGKFPAAEGCDGRLYRLIDLGCDYSDMNELIDNITEQQLSALKSMLGDSELLSQKGGFDADKVKLCSPMPVPKQDIICLGVNYDEHIRETSDIDDFSNKEYTVYFSKRANYTVGSGEKIPHYDMVDSLDYEAELGVIIGKDAKNVSAADAEKYIFGYTVINDVSARNLQLRHKQWYMGKSLDGYTAMGPCIVTADEINVNGGLDISCTVNGELRQSSNTKYMIQNIPNAIAELSAGFMLKKGTVIATGTPGGVGMGMQPPGYMKSGDCVVCTVEKIGSLVNYCE